MQVFTATARSSVTNIFVGIALIMTRVFSCCFLLEPRVLIKWDILMYGNLETVSGMEKGLRVGLGIERTGSVRDSPK